jgi:hypothetical protein
VQVDISESREALVSALKAYDFPQMEALRILHGKLPTPKLSLSLGPIQYFLMTTEMASNETCQFTEQVSSGHRLDAAQVKSGIL